MAGWRRRSGDGGVHVGNRHGIAQWEAHVAVVRHDATQLKMRDVVPFGQGHRVYRDSERKAGSSVDESKSGEKSGGSEDNDDVDEQRGKTTMEPTELPGRRRRAVTEIGTV